MTGTTVRDIAHLYAVHNEGLVLRLSKRFSPELAEDAAAHAWQKLIESEKEIRYVVAWLATVARNWALAQLRRHRNEYLMCDDVVLTVELEDPDPTPDAAAEEAERLQALQSALAALTPKINRTVQGTFFEGFKRREVAEIMNCTIGTVQTRLTKGLKTLKVQLTHF